MRIAVLDDYGGAFGTFEAAQRLVGHEVRSLPAHLGTPRALAEAVEGCEVLLLTQQRTALPRAMVEALPASVRLLCQTGRSTAHLDLEACAARGLAVRSAGGGDPIAPAELTWALILASRRQLVAAATALRSGDWAPAVGRRLAGQRLGVWAFGRIGARVAEVGRAFGMRVWCHGRAGSLERARAAGLELAPSREAFFAESDVLTLHLPLLPETRGLVTAEDLGRMSTDALLVNTSRAGLLAAGALEAALDRGRPGFAAVDVFDEEPASPSHPLVAHPRVLCTPHLGYVERETLEAAYGAAVDAILAFAAGA